MRRERFSESCSRLWRVIGGLVWVLLLGLSPVKAGSLPPGPQIQLQARVFDPLQDAPSPAVTDSLATEETPGVYLVQFNGPIKPQWKEQVRAAGGILYDYIPDYAFVARMDAKTAQQVAVLPAVRWVGPYLPTDRISPSLRRWPAGQRVEVKISTFPQTTMAVAPLIQATGGEVIARVETDFGGTLRARLAIDAIAALARSPEVRWIEPATRFRLLNDVARSQTIMNVERVWDLGLYGTGQIVGYSDSGLDVGDLETLSADFKGRVRAVHPLGEDNTAWNDPVGHGTHVAGSILGNGTLSGSDPEQHRYTGSLAGMAPEAELVVQAFQVDGLTGEINGIPEDLNVLFQQAYADGARIHSNSWGGGDDENEDNPFGRYVLEAQQADEFAWAHPDMTLVFAAGNAGVDFLPNDGILPGDGVVDADSLLAPGTAKNVITVGASESLRPPGSGGMSSMSWLIVGLPNFIKPPIVGDYVSDNPSGMAAFSSRGPTDDGRVKPDVVAPGTNIVSARSHDPGFLPILGSWGLYEPNEHYVFNGGTSMATPLVAGAATLVRQWYVEKQGVSQPSSALIKATLINGAFDMFPGQYGTGANQEMPPRPNSVEGWGRVDLYRSLVAIPPRKVWFDDHTAGLETEDQVVYQAPAFDLEVVNFGVPLQVTLVWTDYPGAPAAAKQLVNDLDLIVVGPDGQRWYGNGVRGDRINNVEGVDIHQPARGRYQIIVNAHNVPQEPQPYALVVAGGFTKAGTHQSRVPFISR